VLAIMSAFAGRSLWIDEAVYASESATGDRNRALAHLLKSYDVIEGSVHDAVETYFRQCSVLVTVRDLAVMAATLAFGGRNPVTKKQVIDSQHVPGLLAIMSTAGMYDDSGKWLFHTGLPTKSGVSGGVMAVASSQFGVAAFSPRLDAHGNSVRASAIVEILSERFGLHVLEPHESIAAPGISVEQSPEGPIVRLGGELGFAGAERVLSMLREIATAAPNAALITVDAAELARSHPAAVMVLRTEIENLAPRFRLRE
jgi:glutaminase